MKQRSRIHYTESQKALMWDRWQRGESLHSIARLFGRGALINSTNSIGDGRHTTTVEKPFGISVNVS